MSRNLICAFLFLASLIATTECHASADCIGVALNQKEFATNLRSFFGPLKVNWFWSNGDAAKEAFEGIYLNDSLQYLDDNHTFVSGCRMHSCTEKVAVIAECPSTFLAIGILHSDCAEARPSSECWKNDILTIFFNDKNKSQYGRHAIEQWAKEEISKQAVKFGASEEINTIEYRSQSNKLIQSINGTDPVPQPNKKPTD